MGPIRVRIGIHTGTPYVGEQGYVGVDVHRAARITACGHGGQVLLSAIVALVGTDGGAGAQGKLPSTRRSQAISRSSRQRSVTP